MSSRKTVGLALGSGSSRGWAHIGAIEALEEAGLRDAIKIMVGGAPVNGRFADEIGADGYAPDAGEAVDLAKKLMGDR